MKPPEDAKIDLVRQWLLKAEEDLALARLILETDARFLSAAGFHAQQAAEKNLKAYLVWMQVEFPKTHDLKALLKLVGKCKPALAASLQETSDLTDFAVEFRYPADIPPMKLDRVLAAVAIAEKTYRAIAAALRETGFPLP